MKDNTFLVWKVVTGTTKIDENNPGDIISWFQNSEGKEKILKASREDKKQVVYKGVEVSVFNIRDHWGNIFKILRENYFQLWIPNQMKRVYEIKTFFHMEDIKKSTSPKFLCTIGSHAPAKQGNKPRKKVTEDTENRWERRNRGWLLCTRPRGLVVLETSSGRWNW